MRTSDERPAPQEFELQLRSQDLGHEHGDPQEPSSSQQELKPVDQGRDAWVVLIAGFVFEAVFWGFPMCFGVFQNYYSHVPEFKYDSAKIPLVGTLAQALYYLGAPFSAVLTKLFPKFQRQQIWVGWSLCIVSLLTASFTTSVNGLIGTQGLLYGLGFVTLTYPIISMLNEWWVARKGMAFGLISASSGATGTVMPFIIESLLTKYGHRTTLRASALAMAFLTAPLLPLFRGRLPPSQFASLSRADWAFLKRPLFWIYGSSILVQGLGFFFPVVFLPSYAASIDISPIKGALLLALMSIAQVLGQFAFGYMSDKNLSVSFLAIACCVAAATASFILWGLAKSMPFLTVFSLIYGFFGFGFGTMRVAMGRAASGDPATVFAIYAMYVFLQGVGNVLVGPISAALISGAVTRERFGAGKYGGIVILTGTSSIVAALVISIWHCYQGLQELRG
ncbi:MFS general substrate transporter [Lipomyces tetrasporus]|uniref:MFS general substrate transporter n=1 Tax=Lipomyces tetrasporus TaxID=54092 RepID=A0AAD7VRN9_9ASCO|nr:MFS general substrate transporter [Lipomyces tetrasporus]KAJ8098320.1 MFS general substrate transporter [Lipomyces tetrasporus]